MVESTVPKINSTFTVGLEGESLVFTRDACTDEAFNEKFFLDVHPVDLSKLRTSNWVQANFPGRDFRTLKIERAEAAIGSEKCRFSIQIEGYKPRLIRVGQMSSLNHISWEGFLVPDARHQYELSFLGLSLQVGSSIVMGGIGRYMILDPGSPIEVVNNFKAVFFDNVSFSVFFLLLVTISISTFRSGGRLFYDGTAVLTIIWFLLFLIFLVQLLLVDFNKTSNPGFDTRFSRFVLWLPPLVCLAFYQSWATSGRNSEGVNSVDCQSRSHVP